MQSSVLREIQALRRMSVGELRQRWLELHGEPTDTRNRQHLFRRLAWEIQARAYGGLSDRACARIDELVPDTFPRARKAKDATTPRREAQSAPVRDIRMPTPGTVLTRPYKGHEIRVVTLEDGFEWEGRRYGSLSAVAWAVTGQKWNGLLFFGLTQRKR